MLRFDFKVTVLLGLPGLILNIVTTADWNSWNSSQPSTYCNELWVEGTKQSVQRRKTPLVGLFWCYSSNIDVFTLGNSRFDWWVRENNFRLWYSARLTIYGTIWIYAWNNSCAIKPHTDRNDNARVDKVYSFSVILKHLLRVTWQCALTL
jgi:hypothetical protein